MKVCHKTCIFFTFLLSINIFVWQNVLYFLDSPHSSRVLAYIEWGGDSRPLVSDDWRDSDHVTRNWRWRKRDSSFGPCARLKSEALAFIIADCSPESAEKWRREGVCLNEKYRRKFYCLNPRIMFKNNFFHYRSDCKVGDAELRNCAMCCKENYR